ncbi:hypothetical protein EV182_007719 [Spiromyces aspiralis]|uniref:Uncharacterized protein n=1 Tax=Spiromyces aspiralis TaxID=68401 RepID=A0ACC1H7P9_9FUNG|nr:hypothetical protein EV182_007719 [Spiromyces aspiralis]
MVATTSVDQNSAIPDGVKEIIHRALSTGQVNDLTSLVRSKNKKVVRESPGESADAPSTSNGNKRKTADEAASDESAKKVRAKAADPQ